MQKRAEKFLVTFSIVLLVAVYCLSLFLRPHVSACVHEQRLCWQRIVDGELSANGISAAIALVEKLYAQEPSFRPECYSVTSELGQATYRLYPDPTKLRLSPQSALCNYGFYHFYARSLLIATKDAPQAAAFCVEVGAQMSADVPAIEFECFRGIGRGLPFADQRDRGDARRLAAFATHICKAIAPVSNDYGACLSGVFNELGHEEGSGVNGPSVNRTDPLALCAQQSDQNIAAHCWGNYKWAALSLVDLANVKGDASYISHLYSATSTATASFVFSLGYELASRGLSAPQSFAFEQDVRTCASLTSPMDADCIHGYVVGLAKNGAPWRQHEQVIDFCTRALRDMRGLSNSDCPTSQAIGYIRGFYSPAQFEAACRMFRSSLGRSCDGVANVGYGQ